MSDGLTADIRIRRSPDFDLDLRLSIPAGRTVALLGPNGAGKSTAVTALAGLHPIDAGRIELGGRVLDDPRADILVPPERRRVGVVFQDHLLFPHMSALENVAFGLRGQRAEAYGRGGPRGGDDAKARAESWMRRLGVRELAARRPRELSGGQARRVALARALATDPDLLLLDEPLSALDVSTRREMRRFLKEHLDDCEGPRLLITHEPGEAFELADEILVIEDGRVTQAGSADDIRLRPRTAYAAELGGSNLLVGAARDGVVQTGDLTLVIAAPDVEGQVRVSIRPTAISVHRERPGGSPRNRWRTVVERLQDDGSRVRMLTGRPQPLVVEVTPAAKRELQLAPGSEIWLSVKATEIGVELEGGPST